MHAEFGKMIVWLGQPELGDTIKRVREAKGLSQGKLAEGAMMGAGYDPNDRKLKARIQVAISALEFGTKGRRHAGHRRTGHSRCLPYIEKVLGVSLRREGAPWREMSEIVEMPMVPPPLHTQHKAVLAPGQEMRRYPVYATSPDRGGGSIINASEIADAEPFGSPHDSVFGVRISSQAMEPTLRPGDIAWVNPIIAPQIGDDCFFCPIDYKTNMLRQLRHLEGETEDSWIVRQYNPETTCSLLLKAEWPHCYKIVGRRSR
jgi:transcriptional regulator with XRE-family HTH domain